MPDGSQEHVVLLVLYVMGRPEHLGVPRLKVVVMPAWGCLARAQETARMGSTSWGSPDAPHLETALDSPVVHALPAVPVPVHGSFSPAWNHFPPFSYLTPKFFSIFFFLIGNSSRVPSQQRLGC